VPEEFSQSSFPVIPKFSRQALNLILQTYPIPQPSSNKKLAMSSKTYLHSPNSIKIGHKQASGRHPHTRTSQAIIEVSRDKTDIQLMIKPQIKHISKQLT